MDSLVSGTCGDWQGIGGGSVLDDSSFDIGDGDCSRDDSCDLYRCVDRLHLLGLFGPVITHPLGTASPEKISWIWWELCG